MNGSPFAEVDYRSDQVGWATVRTDRVRNADGETLTFSYLDHPGGVIVIPVSTTGTLLLVRHFRQAVQRWCLELPAGGVEAGEDTLDTARRELGEETGAVATTAEVVGSFFTTPSSSNEQCWVVLARFAERGDQRLEPGEALEVEEWTIPEALATARAGGIEDGPSALALLMAEDRLTSMAGLR